MVNNGISAGLSAAAAAVFVDELLYAGRSLAAFAFFNVAWVLWRHAACAFYAASGNTGRWAVFLLYVSAVDFLCAAMEKRAADFSCALSSGRNLYGQYSTSISEKKRADGLDYDGSVLYIRMCGRNLCGSLEYKNFHEKSDINTISGAAKSKSDEIL